MKRLIFILSILLLTYNCFATSNPFPAYEAAPAYTTYFADGIPNNTYHTKPTGNDSTGDGSFGSPWISLAGGQGTVSAGDLVLFHEGTYTTYVNGSFSGDSTNRLETSGTDSDRIVIMGANSHPSYTGEATPLIDVKDYFGMTLNPYQVLDGINFQGGLSLYTANIVIQNCDFDEGCAGQRDGNPGMIVYPAEAPFAQNITIRNNSFHDSVGDHVNGNGRDYAIIMFDSNTNSVGGTWNGNHTKILYNTFYGFTGATSQKFIIYGKDTTHGVEIGYNRFWESNAWATAGFGQEDVNTEGWDVHHNLVSDCDGLGIYFNQSISAKWRSNVIIYDDYDYTTGNCSPAQMYGFAGIENGDTSPQAWGDIYDNVIYVEDPASFCEGSATNTGYWEWVDYNAYESTAKRDAFENAKSASTNWQQHAVTTPFTVTVDGSYFATVEDDYEGLGAGRYGGNIGGFTFGVESSEIGPGTSSTFSAGDSTVIN